MARITTFFLDKSIHRPRGIVILDEFWTHNGEKGEIYRSVAPGEHIPVLTGKGVK